MAIATKVYTMTSLSKLRINSKERVVSAIHHLCSLAHFFLVFNQDFISILHVSQPQTQQQMTSQIRAHVEYLIQTYNILVLISDRN